MRISRLLFALGRRSARFPQRWRARKTPGATASCPRSLPPTPIEDLPPTPIGGRYALGPLFPCAWALAAVAGLALALPASAQDPFHVDLVCPCRVETTNLTSISVTFGVRNFHETMESDSLTAVLEGRPAESNGDWTPLASFHVPAVAANSTLAVQSHTAPFKPPDDKATYELRLSLLGEGGFFPLDSIYWMVDPVEFEAGGGSFSSVYFDGTPKVTLAGTSVTLELPAIRNAAGGSRASQVLVSLVGADGLEFKRDGTDLAKHEFGQDLDPGGEIAAARLTLTRDSAESFDYLQLVLRESGNNALAYETVDVPDGQALPARTVATADASILVDSDEDGVGDVNERLMDTDPDDAESKPEDSTIDILALYSPGFPELYNGDPSTRIRHVITLADAIFRDSGVNAGLRLVGMAEIPVDESHAFSDPDEDAARESIELHGADIAVMFRPFAAGSEGLCGWAFLGGFRSRGTGLHEGDPLPVVHVFGDCGAHTTAHEIGHAMGLAHSYAQGEVGTFRWSRGHGVHDQFATVMAYALAYGGAPKLDVFSSPEGDCKGSPCGVDISQVDGADALTTLNATRFQVANFAEAKPDSDEDGFIDPIDAFPNDPTEVRDSDGDGTGDNADPDDDNDGVADSGDLFPFDPAEWADSDGDGVGNNADAFPRDRFETADSDGDGVGDNGDRFPKDPAETVDTDGDGVGNNGDAFPFDTREWLDSDGDGVGDNADEDADNDGVANIHDAFPRDASRSDLSSYKFVVTNQANEWRSFAPAGDIDGDNRGDFLVGLTYYDFGQQTWSSVAYLVAAADLAAADAADGSTDRAVNVSEIASQPGSWKFIGESAGDQAGHSLAAAGDINGDGVPELMIGAPGALSATGAAYVISVADLAAADAADGETDGVASLGNIAGQDNSWKIIGEGAGDNAGASVGAAGDLNGDGSPELLVGAMSHDGMRGALYVIPPKELAGADEADGIADGVVGLANMASRAGYLKLLGQDEQSDLGTLAPSPYTDANGKPGLIVTSEAYRGNAPYAIGAVYLLSDEAMDEADEADGALDGVVELGRAAAAPDSWQFVGSSNSPLRGAAALGDIDEDGLPDFFIASIGSAFLVSGADLALLDGNDGVADGVIQPHGLDAPNSWEAVNFWPNGRTHSAGNLDGDGLTDLATMTLGEAYLLSGADLAAAEGGDFLLFGNIPSVGRSWQAVLRHVGDFGARAIGLAGDVDSDGLDDALIFAQDNAAYLLVSADLGALDAADDRTDGLISLMQLSGDADGDGIRNVTDDDDDNDGYRDFEDEFPDDAADWADWDKDGVGDNSDAFPTDWQEQFDTDGDGVGDWADSDDDGDGVLDQDDTHPMDTDNDGTDNPTDGDDDNDGVADAEDRFPLDSAESVDTDGDGVGNNADSDDDNDGVEDESDALPLDPGETADEDEDGVGDNSDAFPADPDESDDNDGDGIGDNADTDDDNDGVSDEEDAFPADAAESGDSDGDGIGNNADAFPADASEWADNDGDGTGDNADTDDDNDAFTDAADAFSLDPARARLFHYRLKGENPFAQAGHSVSAGDLNGDGRDEALIGAPGTTPYISPFIAYGAAYTVAGSDLETADLADGVADGTISLGGIAQQPGSNAITGQQAADSAGQSIALVGDRRDGGSEWMLGAPYGEGLRGAAYLISPTGLDAADAVNGADGTARLGDIAGQSESWVFVGEDPDDKAGSRVASSGDVNGDGHTDLLIGAPDRGEEKWGVAYLVSGADLGAADAADGETDGRIDLARNKDRADSWKFRGESARDGAGALVASAGDIDGDGKPDLIIGAPYHSGDLDSQGALYLIAGADLASADAADGKTNGVIRLANVAAQAASWKILGEDIWDYAGYEALTADIDGDGGLELIVGAPGHEFSSGAIYVLPLTALQAADDADGTSDRVVNLGWVAALENAWKLTGDRSDVLGLFGFGSSAGSALGASDSDGDGRADLVVGAADYIRNGVWCPAPGQQRQSGAVYLISGADLASADAADGERDGVLRLANVSAQPNSWQLLGEATDRLGSSVSAAGDLDGDGRSDLVLGAANSFRRYGSCGQSAGDGLAVVISSAELAAADRRDGAEDGVVDFEALKSRERSVDFDFDGVEGALDPDDDNDGVADANDTFPLDPAESADHDHDGIGDNADSDDDNDGAPDTNDAFPLDPYETEDSDGDGVGNNRDTDDDNDGVPDSDDAFPLDASETEDSDGDGTGDNADDSPDDAAIDSDGDGTADSDDTDDDDDGVADTDDLFPLDDRKSDLFFFKIAGGARALPNTDFDGDDWKDLVVGAPGGETTLVAEREAILVSSADLHDADNADGSTDRIIDFAAVSVPANSWKLEGSGYDQIFPAGDVDSDGKGDLIVGDLLVSASSLPAEDAVYGDTDRVLNLSSPLSARRQAGIWRLTGTQFDCCVYSLGDLNADGRDDVLIGAPQWRFKSQDSIEVAYVASGADWQSADTLDGADDGDISLDELASRSGSWKIESETHIALGASISPAGDVNGDGHADLMIGAPEMAFGTNPDAGGVLVLSGAAMSSLDAADGEKSGVIVITHGAQTGIWKLDGKDFNAGQAVSAAGDVDADGLDDVIVTTLTGVYLITGVNLLADANDAAAAAANGSRRFAGMSSGQGVGDVDADGLSDILVADSENAYLISGRDLPTLGAADGVVDLRSAALPRHSWRLGFRDKQLRFHGAKSQADLDGDGNPELVLQALTAEGDSATYSSYVLSTAELAVLDTRDAKADGVILLDVVARGWTPDD